MEKINTLTLEEETWTSPSGKFGGAGKQVSKALGRDGSSTDVMKARPFDVEIQRLSPGKISCPYHVHTHQWEFYHVVSGRGYARHADARRRSDRATPFSSSRVSRAPSATTAIRIWCCSWSRTIRPTKPATTPTAASGPSSIASFARTAPSRSTTMMGKSKRRLAR
jgi:hypothetical protein